MASLTMSPPAPATSTLWAMATVERPVQWTTERGLPTPPFPHGLQHWCSPFIGFRRVVAWCSPLEDYQPI